MLVLSASRFRQKRLHNGILEPLTFKENFAIIKYSISYQFIGDTEWNLRTNYY